MPTQPVSNPVALTWVFSRPLEDPAHPEAEFKILKEFSESKHIQYLAFHIVKHSKNHTIYIRAVCRCVVQRSYLQLRDLLDEKSFKPLRGMFTTLVRDEKLNKISRIGDLIEYGTIAPRFKRASECNGKCSHCCQPNKRVASSPVDSSV